MKTSNERKCPLCSTLDEQDGEQDGGVHCVWGCQYPELIPLRQKLRNTLHTLLQYNEMDRDVMLYVFNCFFSTVYHNCLHGMILYIYVFIYI